MDCRGIAIVTATPPEASAARRALPQATVYEAGVALARTRGPFGEAVVSCGLAGALRGDLPAGSVLVPAEIGCPDGTRRRCDPELTAAFAAGARALGFEPVLEPLLTANAIVRGAERERAARLGFCAVDMETGLIAAPRLAAVRVVLDTPARELRGDWLHPLRAAADPRNWPELLWLARDGPRFARRAAEVVKAGCLRLAQAGDAR